MATAIAAALIAGAGQETIEPRCPTDPLAPANTPVVQVDTRPSANGSAAAYGTIQYPRLPDLGPKDIALTFDDGPDPRVTPRVLSVLAQHCIKASFFLVGWYAAAHPELVRAEAAAGHVIGAHTFRHPDNLRRLDEASAEREITHGFQAIQDSLGSPAERAQLAPFFRFPGLNDNMRLRAWLGQKQMAILSADLGADDWKGIGAQQIEQRALRYAAASHGGVLILHDSKPHMAEAPSDLIKAFQQRGYRFVQLVPAPGASERAAAAPGALIGPAAAGLPSSATLEDARTTGISRRR